MYPPAAQMIEEGHSFKALEVDPRRMHVLGTPAQLRSFCVSRQKQPRLRICFDLDHTLVTAPRVTGDYSSCEPIPVRHIGHPIYISTSTATYLNIQSSVCFDHTLVTAPRVSGDYSSCEPIPVRFKPGHLTFLSRYTERYLLRPRPYARDCAARERRLLELRAHSGEILYTYTVSTYLHIYIYSICFDLDHTLVTAPRVSGDYSSCEPIAVRSIYIHTYIHLYLYLYI